MKKKQKQIFHKELSFKIVGLLYKTHDILGCYARERQYGNFLENLLKEHKIPYEREKILLVANRFQNRVDFIIDDKIMLELKVIPGITRNDYYQMQRYLQAANSDLGMIVNFRHKYLKPKRVINYSKNHS